MSAKVLSIDYHGRNKILLKINDSENLSYLKKRFTPLIKQLGPRSGTWNTKASGWIFDPEKLEKVVEIFEGYIAKDEDTSTSHPSEADHSRRTEELSSHPSEAGVKRLPSPRSSSKYRSETDSEGDRSEEKGTVRSYHRNHQRGGGRVQAEENPGGGRQENPGTRQQRESSRERKVVEEEESDGSEDEGELIRGKYRESLSAVRGIGGTGLRKREILSAIESDQEDNVTLSRRVRGHNNRLETLEKQMKDMLRSAR